jgi:hypothetical protein
MENKPTTVPQTAKQVGEILDRWAWVEPAVWTERMLMALETGVKGGKCDGQIPSLPSKGYSL